MALDLNVSPYYDDYQDAVGKKYNRILFKPGFAVQARELTQLQSVLQDQVGKFGGHIFKNGTVVQGCDFKLDIGRDFVKVLDADTAGIQISNLEDYIGATIVGLTSSIQAEIVHAIPGSEAASPDLNTIYLRYLTGDGETSAVHFFAGETLRVTASTTPTQIGDEFIVDDTVENGNFYFGRGSFLTLSDGVIFLDGKFVVFAAQTVELDKYTSVPTYKIGFQIAESIVTPEEDQTLLDPAQGSFNYAAPGADRYVAQANLVKFGPEDTVSEDFCQYINIVQGVVQTVISEDRIYADLGRNLAKRTYDESGNYTVKSFPIIIKEHLDTGTNGGLIPYNIDNPAAGGDETLLAIGFEAGKAYVRGYAYETKQTEYIFVPKGNTTSTDSEVPIATAFGNYILVDNVCGNWDVASGDTVSLRTAAANAVGTSGSPAGGAQSATAAPGSEMGTARVRYMLLEDGNPGAYNTQYRMYLYDIQMASSYNFEDVKGVYYNTTADGHADVVLTTSKAVIYESKFNNLLYKLPARALKTTKPSGSYDNSFYYTKQFEDTIDSSNSITFSVSGNETFPFTVGTLTPTEVDNNIIVTTKAACTINSVAYEVGSVLDLNGSGVTVTNTGSQITVQFPGAISAATNVRILCKVQVADANSITKALKESAVVVIDTNASADTSGTYTLGASDGYRLRSIMMGDYTEAAADIQSGGTDVTSSFTFDNGQRDSFYANARIVKKPGVTLDLTDVKLVVTFDYFTHTGSPSTTYNFCVVDSYPVDDETTPAGTIRTEQIPVYSSPTTGITYDLRDTLDFRPRFDDTITFTTSAATADLSPNPSAGSTPSGPTGGAIITPVPTEQFTTDYEFYLGRKDRLIMDEDGVFSSVYGVPGLVPQDPVEPANGMSIAVVNIPPYPSLAPNVAKTAGRTDYGVKYKAIDNRRYTMRDIGVLEQRLNRLEYYTSLNLLEKAASDLTITDASGLDRFKNGILVDAFTGHNVANVLDNEHHCSIDPMKKELRPFFFMENVDLRYLSDQSTNVQKTGDLLTLPYTEVALTSNLFASKFRNCVGELLFVYSGDMQLDPPVDNWTDTTVLPDIAANFDGNYDAWETMADAWGTQWEDWQDLGTGRVTGVSEGAIVGGNTRVDGNTIFQEQTQVVTTTTEQRQTRQGIQMSVTPETQTQRIGPRVTNTSIIPFMRSITVTFTATRLKPLTRVYPFFDGVAVADNCRPLSSAALTANVENSILQSANANGDWGDPLITDANGNCVGQFRIPAGTFRVGEKKFRLVDDSKNRDKFVTTSATQVFSANGLSQNVQDTVISTRVANVSMNTVSGSRTVTDTNSTTVRLDERTVGTIPAPTVTAVAATVGDTSTPAATITETETVNNTTTTTTTPNEEPVDETTDPVVLTETPQADFDICWNWNWGAIGNACWADFSSIRLDPIAQTFYVSQMPSGCYVTSLDIFFRTKSETAPITLQLREVVNGYPGNTVLPFSEVTLNPSQINVDPDNGETVTTFTFPSPVYLQNNTEYCFVLLPAGNDPNYTIWVSELGENQLNTTTRISEQPNTGVLFTSANNRTWTAWQAEDIKFALNRADFEVGTIADITLSTFNVDYAKFESFSSGAFASGDKVHGFTFDIVDSGTGYTNGTISHTLSGGGATTNATVDVTIAGGVVTDVVVTNPGAGYTSNPTLTISSGSGTDAEVTVTLNYGFVRDYDGLYNVAKIFVESGSFSQNDVVGNGTSYAEIVELEDKILNALGANVGYLEHTTTNLIWSYSATANTGSESSGSTTYYNFVPDKTTELAFDASIRSYSNEQADLGGDKSFNIKLGMNTQTSTVSPVIDLRKCSMVVIANDINNDVTDEDTTVGSAASKYVSRRVVLDDGQEAEDLRVYLSNYLPTGTSVKVYAKFLHQTDPGSFDDKDWIELTTTEALSTQTSSFVEYSYDIPSTSLNGDGVFEYTSGGVTYTGYKTFAVKVVMLSSKQCVVPKVRELRAIALQA